MADQKSSLLRLSVRFVPEGIRNRIALLSPLTPYTLIVPLEYGGLRPSHNFVMSGFPKILNDNFQHITSQTLTLSPPLE